MQWHRHWSWQRHRRQEHVVVASVILLIITVRRDSSWVNSHIYVAMPIKPTNWPIAGTRFALIHPNILYGCGSGNIRGTRPIPVRFVLELTKNRRAAPTARLKSRAPANGGTLADTCLFKLPVAAPHTHFGYHAPRSYLYSPFVPCLLTHGKFKVFRNIFNFGTNL